MSTVMWKSSRRCRDEPAPIRSRRRSVLMALHALLLVALLAPTIPAQAWPVRVGGVYALPQGGVPIPQAVLDDSRISGVVVRWQWQNVETEEGGFDWSYFDEQIARVSATGKAVFLKVSAGGVNVPPFVMEQVATFSFVDDDPYSPQDGTLTIPLFWDPVFLYYKKALIAEMGRHYAANPAVLLVGISCANAKTDDWNVPHTDADIRRWRAVGYASGKLIDACKQTIDAAMRAFQTQHVVLSINSNGRLDSTPNYVSKTVADWALLKYPDRFLLAKHNLSARTPAPGETIIDDWKLVYDRRPNVIGHMLWYVTKDTTCRMNGNVSPCDPASVLRKAVRTGDAYDMPMLEIYHADILNPILKSVIDEAVSRFR